MSVFYYAPKAAQENTSPPEIVNSWGTAATETRAVRIDAALVPYVHFEGDQDDTVANGFFRVVEDINGVTLPQVSDCEIYCELEYDTLAFRQGDFRFCARADLAQTGYAIGPRAENQTLQAVSIAAGTRTTVATQALSPNAVVATRYSVKARLTGTTLEAKFWETGTAEPAYELSVVDSAITAAGHVGIYSIFPNNMNTRLYKFGLGTGGDPAPTDEPIPGPTLTNIGGGTTYVPGASVVLNGTDLDTTGGALTIDGVTQTITNQTDTAVTFTAVRGGNAYDTNLTLTYDSGTGTPDTLTVQQVAGGTGYAVTAADPNTTDEDSLWTGLVDTVTGNPITIVNGDQALLKDVNALGSLSATGPGVVFADTEGNFVVQIWLASEGVWGGDQTVTFTIPDTIGPAVTSVDVPASATYAIGESLVFTGNFDEATTATGAPRLALDIGGTARHADYESGTGTTALLFRHIVLEGDSDAGGISVTALELNGGTLQDAATNNATLTLNNIGATTGVLVDGIRPVITVDDLNTTDTTPTVSGSAGDAVSLVLTVNAVQYNPAPAGGSWSQLLPELAINTYLMTLDGADAAGNDAAQGGGTLVISEVAEPPAGDWRFGNGIKPAIPITWEWGGRHPSTNARARLYRGGQ